MFFLHESRVTFCIRATNECLLYERQVTFNIRVTNYFFHTSYELPFIARVTTYFLTMSYNKDKDDKVFYDDEFMRTNYSLESFFDKNFKFVQPRFHVINI